MDVDCLTPETFFPKMLDCRKCMIFFLSACKTMVEVGFVATSLWCSEAQRSLFECRSRRSLGKLSFTPLMAITFLFNCSTEHFECNLESSSAWTVLGSTSSSSMIKNTSDYWGASKAVQQETQLHWWLHLSRSEAIVSTLGGCTAARRAFTPLIGTFPVLKCSFEHFRAFEAVGGELHCIDGYNSFV